MTLPTPPASNAPAPPRPFGLLARLLMHWLGIADQRRDFNALAMTLSTKDQIVDGQGRDLQAQASVINQLASQLHHWAGLASSMQDRLHWYESRVPQIAGAKKAYDMAIAREKGRREKLIAAHPEWSEATKAHVLQHGTTPGESESANGHGEPAANKIEIVQRMPESEADLVDPSRLRLVDDSASDGEVAP